MDWKKRDRLALKPSRPVCPHTSRSSTRASSSSFGLGKAGICVLCICEKIDDFMESGVENSPDSSQSQPLHSSVVSEIVHNIRLINTSLDGVDESSASSSSSVTVGAENTTLQQVVDSLMRLLKLPNDEVAQMIAQVLEKLGPKINTQMREYLMEKLVNSLPPQKTPEPLPLTIGILECFEVTLQIEECMEVFVQKFIGKIIPLVVQTLRSTSLGFKTRTNVLKETKQYSQSQSSQSQPFVFESSISIFTGRSTGKEVVEKLLSSIYFVMNCILQVNVKSRRGGSENSENDREDEIMRIFLPHFKDIITTSAFYLRENQPTNIVERILGRYLNLN